MKTNKILSGIIIFLFIIFFLFWAVVASILIFTDPSSSVKMFLYGGVYFGFWFMVAYRLWGCPEPDTYVLKDVV